MQFSFLQTFWVCTSFDYKKQHRFIKDTFLFLTALLYQNVLFYYLFCILWRFPLNVSLGFWAYLNNVAKAFVIMKIDA